RARLRPSGRGNRRRRPAEEHAERIGGEKAGHVPPDPLPGDARDDQILYASRIERDRAGRHDDAGEHEDDPAEPPHASAGGNGRLSAGRGGSRSSGMTPAWPTWSAKKARIPARPRTASSRALR